MSKTKLVMTFLFLHVWITVTAQNISCIRINQLGYLPQGIKVAVLGCDQPINTSTFSLIDQNNNTAIFTGIISNNFGKYGPFKNTYRLDFSAFTGKGKYSIQVNDIISPFFIIEFQ